MIKFIHTADIHIGKALTGLPPHIARQRREDIWETFGRVIELCRVEHLDVLFIAGDLAEYEYTTVSMCQRLNYYFKQIPDTRIFLSPGNHDACYKDSLYQTYDWEHNVYIFTEETLSSYVIPELDLTVWGRAFISPEISEPLLNGVELPEASTKYSVLLLHADADNSKSKYLPVDEKELAALPVDYVALGHIHNPAERKGKVQYAGSLEPLDWNDEGDYGIIRGTLGINGVKTEFIPLAKRKFISTRIVLSAEMAVQEVAQKARSIIDNKGKDNLFRIYLQGEYDSESNIASMLSTVLRKEAFCVSIYDQTGSLMNLEAVAAGELGIVASKFLGKINSLEQNVPHDELELIRDYGLQSLLHKKVIRDEV